MPRVLQIVAIALLSACVAEPVPVLPPAPPAPDVEEDVRVEMAGLAFSFPEDWTFRAVGPHDSWMLTLEPPGVGEPSSEMGMGSPDGAQIVVCSRAEDNQAHNHLQCRPPEAPYAPDPQVVRVLVDGAYVVRSASEGGHYAEPNIHTQFSRHGRIYFVGGTFPRSRQAEGPRRVYDDVLRSLSTFRPAPATRWRRDDTVIDLMLPDGWMQAPELPGKPDPEWNPGEQALVRFVPREARSEGTSVTISHAPLHRGTLQATHGMAVYLQDRGFENLVGNLHRAYGRKPGPPFVVEHASSGWDPATDERTLWRVRAVVHRDDRKWVPLVDEMVLTTISSWR